MNHRTRNTLVLGLGNPILGDDAVGLHVMRAVRRIGPHLPDVEYRERCVGGLDLLFEIEGFERLVLVDAMINGGREVDDGLLNRVEMAFRAYDPCMACATHALPGEMPLVLEIYGGDGSLRRRLRR